MALRLLYFWSQILTIGAWLAATILIRKPTEDAAGLFIVLGVSLGGFILLGTPLGFALERLPVALGLPSAPLTLALGVLLIGSNALAGEGAMAILSLSIGFGGWLTWMEVLKGKEQSPPSSAIGMGVLLGLLGVALEITLLARGEALCLVCWLPHVGVILIAHQLDRWRGRAWKSEIEREKPASPAAGT